MRIVGGAFRGTTLYGPKGSGVRPTSDRAREALFNILAPRIEGAWFLDLYAGTGAVGLEALSRGAGYLCSVEIDTIDLIRKNAAKCGVTTSEKFKVIRGKALQAIEVLRERGERFDIIYADPPWKQGREEETLAAARWLLKEGGTIILEAFHKRALAPIPGLAPAGSRRYGDTALFFFEPQPGG